MPRKLQNQEPLRSPFSRNDAGSRCLLHERSRLGDVLATQLKMASPIRRFVTTGENCHQDSTPKRRGPSPLTHLSGMVGSFLLMELQPNSQRSRRYTLSLSLQDQPAPL